ncbi:MAG: hypothetical protein WC364_03725 [Eubacteriales bacterium]
MAPHTPMLKRRLKARLALSRTGGTAKAAPLVTRLKAGYPRFAYLL